MKELIARCKKGNKGAQMEIYKKYFHAMYNTSYRILNNQYEAEDVMQEAFLAAFTKMDSYKGEVTFGAWLKRIVINKSITALKKYKQTETHSLEIAYESSDEEIDNSVFLSDDLNVKVILDCIQKLKENYRIGVTLHLIEGYDYEEISSIMNISYDNSRAIVSRAKGKLRKMLIDNSEISLDNRFKRK
ncbi:RNA polymerase sigma factor [Aureivirga marina]|uniref:RNA polymerase sigma factor n=1 Tax=Aureivirga marina TaxID=1182451 RepID=UPI0018CBE878|nr:RNA polymerase sigma factor [Aureivirga marina]